MNNKVVVDYIVLLKFYFLVKCVKRGKKEKKRNEKMLKQKFWIQGEELSKVRYRGNGKVLLSFCLHQGNMTVAHPCIRLVVLLF